jgi:multidrug efflux pump
MTSASREEVSSITLEFTLDRDVEAAAQDVREKVSRARRDLPSAVEEPVIAKQEADASPVVILAVTAKPGSTVDLLQLTDAADRLVQKRIENLPGVARAELYGERRYAMRVWLDNAALTARGLTVQDVEDAIRSRSVEIPGGRIESREREFTVRSLGELKTPAQFAELTVSNAGGQLVKLKDVGRVELGPENDRVIFRADRQDGVAVGVVRQSKSNLVEVAKAVEAALPAIQASLPPGVTVRKVYDTAQYVERSILEAEETLLIAAGLVVVIIFVFLRTLRGTLIPAIAIPVSIIATFGVMALLDYTVNNFTLLALILAIGIVVDDAIIVLENAYRHQEELGEDPETAAINGTREIALAVIAVTLALVAVFVPLAFLTGTTGRLLNEFGVTVAAAIGISGFVALTLTPTLCAKILRLPKKRSRFYVTVGKGLDWLSSRYRASLAWALGHRWWVVGGGAAIAVLAGVLVTSLKREFLPSDDRGYLITVVIAPEGATADYTLRYQRRIEDVLAKTPDVQNHVSMIGFPEDPTRGLMFGMFTDWSTRERTSFDIINEVQPLSVFAVNLVIALGLGLAIDYSLFIVSRYREELARRGPGAEAIRRTLQTAGRTVLFSALTVAAALASLLVFPLRFLYSMGLGGALAALVAAAAALVALPALLMLLGERVTAMGATPGLIALVEQDAAVDALDSRAKVADDRGFGGRVLEVVTAAQQPRSGRAEDHGHHEEGGRRGEHPPRSRADEPRDHARCAPG